MAAFFIGQLNINGREALVAIRRRLYNLCCDLGYTTIAATQIAAGFSELYHSLEGKIFPLALEATYWEKGLQLVVGTPTPVTKARGFSYFSTFKLNQKNENRFNHIFHRKNINFDPEESTLTSAAAAFVRASREELFEQLEQKNRQISRMHEKAEELVRIRTRQLDLTQEITIESLATLAESRDPETGGHIKRTQEYVLSLAHALKKHGHDPDRINNQYIEFLAKSAPLHDIGKVGIPDAVLLKPGRLNDHEYEIMKSHTLIGAATLREAQQKLGEQSFLNVAEELIMAHHEKWDGTGYPGGLTGEEIPLAGRIMALADVYDALICKRVYKPPFNHSKTKEILLKERGKHFDPTIVDTFIQVEEEFRAIGIRFADDDEEIEALKK